MTPTIDQQLLEALTEFLGVTAAAHLPTAERKRRLNDSLTRILKLEKQLGDDAHPMLRHYLARRSYTKAMEFLSTGGTPKC